VSDDLIIEEPKEPVIYRVVDSADLESFTRQGWILCRVLQEDIVVWTQWTAPQAPSATYNMGSTTNTPVVTKAHRFLMRLGKDESIAKIEGEKRQLVDKLNLSRAETYEAQTKIRNLENQVSLAGRQFKNEESAHAMTRDELDRTEKKWRAAVKSGRKNVLLKKLQELMELHGECGHGPAVAIGDVVSVGDAVTIAEQATDCPWCDARGLLAAVGLGLSTEIACACGHEERFHGPASKDRKSVV